MCAPVRWEFVSTANHTGLTLSAGRSLDHRSSRHRVAGSDGEQEKINKSMHFPGAIK